MRRVALVIATAGGAGYAPIAPGTAGSAVGVVLYLLTRHWPGSMQIGLLLLVCAAGIWASNHGARHFQKKDPGHVVIDEVAGQLLTLLLTGAGWLGAAIGFFLFRLLDIVKPWPANRLEALPEGLGVMADDLMAGVYGCVAMHVVLRVLPEGW
jgi:phosphatidylglycerophosphatase A